MIYKVIYDIQNDNLVLWPDLVLPAGLFLVAMCLVFLVVRFNWFGLSKSKKYILGIVAVVGAISATSSVFGDLRALQTAKKAAATGKFTQIEGRISQYQEYRPRTREVGGSWEYFVVDDKRFVVEPSTIGFRTTIKNGSPLSVGAQVRVRFLTYGDHAIIVHLEMM
jgi:hypothetical protein